MSRSNANIPNGQDAMSLETTAEQYQTVNPSLKSESVRSDRSVPGRLAGDAEDQTSLANRPPTGHPESDSVDLLPTFDSRKSELLAAISRLPSELEAIVTRRSLEGRPFAVVATGMNRSVEAVQELWLRAMIHLRDELMVEAIDHTVVLESDAVHADARKTEA